MKFRTARFSLMTVAAAVAFITTPAWAQLKMGFNVPLTGFAAEMSQCSYMQEGWPFEYLPKVAAGVQPHVRHMLEAVLAFVEEIEIKT
jgi:hypothetical protein